MPPRPARCVLPNADTRDRVQKWKLGFALASQRSSMVKAKVDIIKAFDTKQFDAEIDEEDYRDKYLLIGFDDNANLIEVMYSVIGVDKVLVFHVMKCRKVFISLL